jgi:glutamate synthase (ferredoxin)
MSDLVSLTDAEEIEDVKGMIERHVTYTKSALAKEILSNWSGAVDKFVKVMPRDYRKILEAIERVAKRGLTGDEASLTAFREAIAE